MPAFSGRSLAAAPTIDDDPATDLLVGEIRGLRTFRVEHTGRLLPLYSASGWDDGINTAVCAPPAGRHRGPAHVAPGDGCECGFYAFGTARAVRRYRQASRVQAVVACWGSVVAGSQGVRAEHARVEAIWLHRSAAPYLRRRVATRYPSARLYDDVDVMLAEHPLTDLDCYTSTPRRQRLARPLSTLGAAAGLALGLLPLDLLRASGLLWGLWLAALVGLAGLAAWLLTGSRMAGHVAAGFIVLGLIAWLIAPVLGLAGWLLRLPVLRALAVAGGGWIMARSPGHFPVVEPPRERLWFGART